MKNKIVSPPEALAIVRDGDTLAFSGFVGSGTPEELIAALEQRFVSSGTPRDLTLLFAAAPGDGKERGLNRLAKPGLVRRAIGGHWALVPKLAAMAVSGQIEAYNLPLGTLSQLFRDIAGRRAGTLTKIGLRTFVDPRVQGGRINDRTRRGPGPRDGDRRRGVAVLQGVPGVGRAASRNDGGSFRQHHDGARGADARQPRARDGGEEQQRLRHRAGRARLRARCVESAPGADSRRARRLRRRRAGREPCADLRHAPTAPRSPASSRCRSTCSARCRSTSAR